MMGRGREVEGGIGGKMRGMGRSRGMMRLRLKVVVI